MIDNYDMIANTSSTSSRASTDTTRVCGNRGFYLPNAPHEAAERNQDGRIRSHAIPTWTLAANQLMPTMGPRSVQHDDLQ